MEDWQRAMSMLRDEQRRFAAAAALGIAPAASRAQRRRIAALRLAADLLLARAVEQARGSAARRASSQPQPTSGPGSCR